MDKGYDAARVYAECEERGCEPVIPLRGAKGKQPVLPIGIGGRLFPRIRRDSQRFRDLYPWPRCRRKRVRTVEARLRPRLAPCPRVFAKRGVSTTSATPFSTRALRRTPIRSSTLG
jgi:hypothetical protein